MKLPTELKRALLIIAGIAFLVLGFMGLALPFLQGFLFLAIGIAMLSLASRSFRQWLHSYTMKFPRFHAYFQKFENWLEKMIGPAA